MIDKIIGCWEIDPDDARAINIYGHVSMEFRRGGELIYTISTEGRKEIILMTFDIKGDLLITNQASAPNRQETMFKFVSDGMLALFFDGEKSIYRKRPCD